MTSLEKLVQLTIEKRVFGVLNFGGWNNLLNELSLGEDHFKF